MVLGKPSSRSYGNAFWFLRLLPSPKRQCGFDLLRYSSCSGDRPSSCLLRHFGRWWFEPSTQRLALALCSLHRCELDLDLVARTWLPTLIHDCDGFSLVPVIAFGVSPCSTRSLVPSCDVFHTPADLSFGVSHPVGTFGGHLRCRQRLRNSIGSARWVSGQCAPL